MRAIKMPCLPFDIHRLAVEEDEVSRSPEVQAARWIQGAWCFFCSILVDISICRNWMLTAVHVRVEEVLVSCVWCENR